MFSQGVSNRTHPMKLNRVFHMLVRDDDASTGWRTWCGYSLAREDSPKPYPNARLCGKCKQLARDGLADGMMDVGETDPFATGDGAE